LDYYTEEMKEKS